jgi:hypothetical protein
MQGNAYLSKDWFQSYSLNTTDQIDFSFDIKVLDSCMNLLGKDDCSDNYQSQGQNQFSQTFNSYQSQTYRSQQTNHKPPTRINSSFKLSYPPEGGELKLILKDDGFKTTCKLSLYEFEPNVSLIDAFMDYKVTAKIIIKVFLLIIYSQIGSKQHLKN